MGTIAGSKNPDLWNATAARLRLRHVINESIAARVASTQLRLKIESGSLERRRHQIVRAARLLSDTSTPEESEAVTQAILGYYRDQGAVERKAAGE